MSDSCTSNNVLSAKILVNVSRTGVGRIKAAEVDATPIKKGLVPNDAEISKKDQVPKKEPRLLPWPKIGLSFDRVVLPLSTL